MTHRCSANQGVLNDPSGTVRDRMLEFVGSAAYISGSDGTSNFAQAAPCANLPKYLRQGLEVHRSLWDRDLFLVHVDLEYHNFDNPAAPWFEPERAFRLQQPVLDATLGILGHCGLVPLVLVSGRGFHLVWSVNRESHAFRCLEGLGHLPPTLRERYAGFCSPEGFRVDPVLGRAFVGLGLIMEFVWHSAVAAAEAAVPVSIQPTAIEVGPGNQGREIIAFDISEYGDPIHTRSIRIPFSAYLKPKRFEWLLGVENVEGLLPIFEIPLAEMEPRAALVAARDPDAVVELSRRTSVAIPDRSEAMNELISEYQASNLRAFHDEFYSRLTERSPTLPDVRSIRSPEMPGCVQSLLENPYDSLLKPAALQHVVRVLVALGWSPSSICRVIYEAYLKEVDWHEVWLRLDPWYRAEFYTRLFAGMVIIGTDKLIDFNCVSHREKGFCTIPDCRSNLVTYRDMLTRRKS